MHADIVRPSLAIAANLLSPTWACLRGHACPSRCSFGVRVNISALLTDSRKMTYILGGFIAVVVFIALIFVVSQSGGGGTGQAAELEGWGVFDDFVAFDDAFTAFEKAYPDITVNYRVVPFADYERKMLNALAAGMGPEVFMVHSTWRPRD